MIKQFKMYCSLLKYTFEMKTNIIFCIIFPVIGIITEIATKGTSFLGPFFLYMIAMYPGQMLYSLGFSGEFSSSPYRKKVLVDGAWLLSFVGNVGLYTIIVILKLVEAKLFPQNAAEYQTQIVLLGLVALIVLLYAAVVYKFFWAAFVVFVFMYMILYTCSMNGSSLDWVEKMSFVQSVGIGYAVSLLGSVLQYVVSRLLYRFPLSRQAQGSRMKKYI